MAGSHFGRLCSHLTFFLTSVSPTPRMLDSAVQEGKKRRFRKLTALGGGGTLLSKLEDGKYRTKASSRSNGERQGGPSRVRGRVGNNPDPGWQPLRIGNPELAEWQRGVEVTQGTVSAREVRLSTQAVRRGDAELRGG